MTNSKTKIKKKMEKHNLNKFEVESLFDSLSQIYQLSKNPDTESKYDLLIITDEQITQLKQLFDEFWYTDYFKQKLNDNEQLCKFLEKIKYFKSFGRLSSDFLIIREDDKYIDLLMRKFPDLSLSLNIKLLYNENFGTHKTIDITNEKITKNNLKSIGVDFGYMFGNETAKIVYPLFLEYLDYQINNTSLFQKINEIFNSKS